MFERIQLQRLLPLLSVIFIVGVLVLSGPLVIGGNTGIPIGSSNNVGDGSANVSLAESPSKTVWIKESDFGSNQFIIDAPDATVQVSAVSGSPLLNYKIQITELGYAKTSIRFLEPSTEGRLRLTIPPESIDSQRVKRDRYKGELFIILRASGEEIIYHENVTVHVER